jgi:hypothetical protein
MELPRSEFVDPAEAAAANEVLARPKNEAVGNISLKDLKPVFKEHQQPSPDRLDPDYCWFFPALAYCMMGMDKSLFELYFWALDKSLEVRSYKADKLLATFSGADVTNNPWFYIIQGIPKDTADDFKNYIETYEFRRPVDSKWCLRGQYVRYPDPFYTGTPKVGVDLCVLLPVCLTTKRKVIILTAPGLALENLELGIVKYE